MRLESGYRSAAQDLALILAQEMFGILVEIVVQLLPNHLHYQPPQSSCNNSMDNLDVASTGSCGGSVSGSPSNNNNSNCDPHRLFKPQLAHFIPAIKVRINSQFIIYFFKE